jgi:hypothetical protein
VRHCDACKSCVYDNAKHCEVCNMCMPPGNHVCVSNRLQQTCGVCKKPLRNRAFSHWPCGHDFHDSCVVKGSTCPICK